jgi:hypothetical protein
MTYYTAVVVERRRRDGTETKGHFLSEIIIKVKGNL